MFVTIITVLLIMSMAIPFGICLKKSSLFKGALLSNILSFFSIMLIATVVLFSGNVFADGETAEAIAAGVKQWAYLSAALVTGMSTIGAGIAVAAAASAALGALSEDDKIMGKALIFVALAEGVALYGLLVSFVILGQVMA